MTMHFYYCHSLQCH